MSDTLPRNIVFNGLEYVPATVVDAIEATAQAALTDNERLCTEIERLRAALTEIRDEPKGTWHGTPGDPTLPSRDYFKSVIEWCQDRATAALRGDDA